MQLDGRQGLVRARLKRGFMMRAAALTELSSPLNATELPHAG